ncbi:MAG: glycosyltransferase family 4 protein [bacterium]|nr:glycosyltransferase family 4 protein [bacterium]
MGYLARVAPEKGLHVLLEAMRDLRQRPGMEDVTLEAAGYLAAEHEPYLEECKQKADGWHYRGELNREEKIRFLQSLDVLSVPCTYDEPKGLFLLEAMANGVPVVQPRRGSFPEIIQKTGGGILTGHDPASLAEGLHRVLTDRELAHRLGRAGHDAVREYYSVECMAARTLEVMSGVAGSN